MPVTKVRPGGWEVRYRAPDGGSRRKRGFPIKRAARTFLAEVEHTKATGAFVEAGRLTFGDYAERWRENQVHRPSTAAQLETNLRRHVLPHFGPRPIGAIKPSDVQAWVKGRTLELAPATVVLLARYVGSIFRAAVADDLIRKSPMVGIKLPKVERARVEPLATDAVEMLLSNMPERYRALVVLWAGTGLRQGEAFGLTLDRVDFLRRTLTVDRQLVLMPGAPPVLGPPKTDASRRANPAPSGRGHRPGRTPAPVPGRAGRIHLHRRQRRPDQADQLLPGRVGPGPAGGQAPGLRDHARPPALLRLAADPARRVREGRPGPPRPRLRRRDPEHLHAPLARLRRPHPPGDRRGSREFRVIGGSRRGSRAVKVQVRL